MKSFSNIQKKAARILQRDIPLTSQPFKEVAHQCGIAESDLLAWLQKLQCDGTVRKFGAVLKHQKAGYHRNALIMWAVPADLIDEAGRRFAELPFISHCYERSPAFQNTYNLFTMLHAQDETLEARIRQMSDTIACSDYLILESLHEYKKTSPEYFE